MKAHNDDTGEAAADGRAPRPDRFRILYAANGLDFRALQMSDPVPLGRQLLETAGVQALAAWALVAILPDGDFEEVRLDEPFDLRGRGAERFIGFETDRLFRAVLADRQLLWGRSSIEGEELYVLAAPPKGEAVFVDVPGGTDRLVRRDETIDLTATGVERFVIGPAPAADVFEIFISYNGITKKLKVRPGDRVAAVIQAALPLFGSPGGDLVLVNQAGQELAPEQTLREAGVKPEAKLLLRPRTVRGG